ncbi:hypothetical protein BLOT_005193 [Blomia tropicalis]|nr:hypothetical protein BLOT_005193 [Blomia tropicalis]
MIAVVEIDSVTPYTNLLSLRPNTEYTGLLVLYLVNIIPKYEVWKTLKMCAKQHDDSLITLANKLTLLCKKWQNYIVSSSCY